MSSTIYSDPEVTIAAKEFLKNGGGHSDKYEAAVHKTVDDVVSSINERIEREMKNELPKLRRL